VSPSVVVLDYGSGNLRSAERALTRAGADVSVTPDLDAEFPAFAARELGWTDVPLMCGREIPVPGALGRCIRVLVSWNTAKSQREIRHAFLHRAKELRPAWAVEV